MQFEWDENKNEINRKKHRIDFETAAWVFYDENHIELYDETHSDEEERFIAIGMVGGIAAIVFVVYTPRENMIRIISARKATKQERRMYYDNSQRD